MRLLISEPDPAYILTFVYRVLEFLCIQDVNDSDQEMRGMTTGKDRKRICYNYRANQSCVSGCENPSLRADGSGGGSGVVSFGEGPLRIFASSNVAVRAWRAIVPFDPSCSRTKPIDVAGRICTCGFGGRGLCGDEPGEPATPSVTSREVGARFRAGENSSLLL